MPDTTTPASAAPGAAPGAPAARPRRDAGTLRLLLRKPLPTAGLAIILAWTVLGLLAPLVAPFEPNRPDTAIKLLAPSAEHWFGTDSYGRDIFTRVLYGARLTLWTGLIGVGISFAVGVPLGAIAAFRGGRLGGAVMRLMDALLAFPQLILAMAIAASLGPGLLSAMIAVGVVGIPEFARIMYGLTLSLKEREFIEAGRALGLTTPAILVRHVFPNALAPLLVRASLGMGFAILTAASLSFLGLGVQPPTPEWGVMISEARGYIITGEWWLATFPGLAIATSILGFNLLGDGLRDVLDPRLRTSR
ncbi:ABC transporter permease [Marinitenerispora sediminis]|uniref:Peptide ABC transporter permease n=1 Tax=Marinitenerispora sediminis TaxID=1931232 RepID=A0A368T9X4_9ACTN|nr:ABC transporter permease [Marinitenerispora sediminis]RCV54595.1 peptide ABC transporter permease [Marinitenerispora sediminis]RCV59850.1 peptide ABC transporter permease [Marinitenerispora sediminis]RCV61177.1 peptide ABC transporter permease [Marinitenerispora sediminis]